MFITFFYKIGTNIIPYIYVLYRYIKEWILKTVAKTIPNVFIFK